MSSDKAPDKVWFVKANFTNENYYITSQNLSGETVLATYIREDLTLDAKLNEPGVITVQEFEQQRRREMFEKVALEMLKIKGCYWQQEARKDISIIAEIILTDADKFARGEG